MWHDRNKGNEVITYISADTQSALTSEAGSLLDASEGKTGFKTSLTGIV